MIPTVKQTTESVWPKIEIINSASTKPGKAKSMKIMMERNLSVAPLKNPATIPMGPPTANPKTMAKKPTVREILEPQIVLENMSRPLVSVPNQLSQFGASRRPPAPV